MLVNQGTGLPVFGHSGKGTRPVTLSLLCVSTLIVLLMVILTVRQRAVSRCLFVGRMGRSLRISRCPVANSGSAPESRLGSRDSESSRWADHRKIRQRTYDHQTPERVFPELPRHPA